MATRNRLVAIIGAVALVAACDGHDPLAPGDISGTWAREYPLTADLADAPDTLVLDSRGGGRIKAHVWLDPVTPGGPYRVVWATAPVEYRIQRDDVFLHWCLQAPEQPPVACTFDGFRLAGRLRKDGRLWIGPTEMTSSMATMPWVRVSRDDD